MSSAIFSQSRPTSRNESRKVSFSAVVHNETCFFVFRIASGWRDTIFDETDEYDDEDTNGTSAFTEDLVDVVA